MTELAELDFYFSSNAAGAEYRENLLRLLEMAGFERQKETEYGTFYYKENPAALVGRDGRYLLPDFSSISGDALDTPFFLSVQIYHDGRIEVCKVTYRMVLFPQEAEKIETPHGVIKRFQIPEIKGSDAIKYLLDLARQANFPYI